MEIVNLDEIRSHLKELQGEKRYNHTLGVEEEAYKLGQIFIPDECERLALAGVLHDITKKLKTDEQLKLCEEYGIEVKGAHNKCGDENEKKGVFIADELDKLDVRHKQKCRDKERRKRHDEPDGKRAQEERPRKGSRGVEYQAHRTDEDECQGIARYKQRRELGEEDGLTGHRQS